MISVCWILALILYKYEEKINRQSLVKYAIVSIFLLILVSYAYGTRQRNKVWKTNESLWHDVTIKSPENGRGLMNFGLSQMERGRYEIALNYFEKALEFSPNYSNLLCNLGIVKNVLNKVDEAEEYFKKSIRYGANTPAVYYFYGNFLKQHQRFNEAIGIYNKTLQLSPASMEARYSLMEIYADLGEWKKLEKVIDETLLYDANDPKALLYIDIAKEKKSKITRKEELVQKDPSSENYVNLSLLYYQNRLYEKCIEAGNKALELEPNNAIAYNTRCISYIFLGEFDKAIESCEKCLQIDSASQLGIGNLNWAKNLKAQTQTVIANPTPESYLNLSLIYYNDGLYERCIDICNEAIKLRPDYFEAYNNICATYNQLGKWEKAMEACEKSIQIKPDFQLAKNNLNWTKENIEQ